jgi:hypothetical protein
MMRRSPWLAGALLLLLAAGLAAPAVWLIGPRRWPLYVGLLAGVLLVFGAVERSWQSVTISWQRRALARAQAAQRSRFQVLMGGKEEKKRKGNGHARDAGEGQDGPGWLM